MFIDGEDYAQIVAFFAGPFTETVAEALLRDLVKSLEFINANAMKETITIPPNSTVAHYVFYPRGDIYGVWGLDLPVRLVRVLEEKDVRLEAVVRTESEAAVVAAPDQP